MYEATGLDKNRLHTQLENYTLIAEVNPELLDRNFLTKEEIIKNLELARGYINESEQWENLGDQTKSNEALVKAHRVIQEISAAIDHLLS